MKRRDAIRLLSGVAAWPLAARARAQAQRRPVIGFLRAGEPPQAFVEGFERGLREHGFVAGQDVVIEFKLGSTDQRSMSSWPMPLRLPLQRSEPPHRFRS